MLKAQGYHADSQAEDHIIPFSPPFGTLSNFKKLTEQEPS